jgi:hypothetical protein
VKSEERTVIISAVGLNIIHLGHTSAGLTIIVGSMVQVVAAFHKKSKTRNNNLNHH